MLNKKLKFSVVLFLILSIIFSFSLNIVNATDDTAQIAKDSESTEAIDETPDTQATEDTKENTLEEISGDLYLSGNDINMNKAVDGNVFIFGKNVTVTGQVNGNLFVFADSVKFDGSYVRYSSFVCASDVYYNGYTTDLYVATNKLEMTYDSYVIRDVKAMSSNAIIKAAIGRDLDLSTGKIDFGAAALTNTETNTDENSEIDDEVPIIYGNLRYSAKNELNLKEGIVEGEVKYNKSNITTSSTSISDILINFGIAIVTVVIIYLLLTKFTTNFINKLTNQSLSNALLALGVGIATFIVVALISIILMITQVGVILGFILLTLLLLLCLLSNSIVAIFATKKLYVLLKLNNKALEYVLLILIAIILSSFKLIPQVGIIVSMLIKLFGVGLILVNIFSKEKEISSSINE